MEFKDAVSRRKFVGGLAAALGYVSSGAGLDVFAQGAPPVRDGRPAHLARSPPRRSTTRWPNSPTTRTTGASPTRS